MTWIHGMESVRMMPQEHLPNLDPKASSVGTVTVSSIDQPWSSLTVQTYSIALSSILTQNPWILSPIGIKSPLQLYHASWRCSSNLSPSIFSNNNAAFRASTAVQSLIFALALLMLSPLDTANRWYMYMLSAMAHRAAEYWVFWGTSFSRYSRWLGFK